MVMVSCAAGDKTAAGKYLMSLPASSRSMLAGRCKAHGVDVALPHPTDPAFASPAANPQPPPPKSHPAPQ